MKKIFAYVGVVKKDSSLTVEYIHQIVDKLKEEVELELFTAEDITIENCRGCLNCFINGICPLDKKDNFCKIKEKIKESDFIILGSPVYFHNVSGWMKTFIDRLTYLSHLFELRHKNGMVVAAADCSGTKIVADYLKKFLEHQGCVVVDQIELKNIACDFEGEVIRGARILEQTLEEPIMSNSNVENFFGDLQRLMKYRHKLGDEGAEIDYWKKHGLLEAKSYLEV